MMEKAPEDDADERYKHARTFRLLESARASLVIAQAVKGIDCYLDSRFQDHRELTDEEEEEYDRTCDRMGLKRLADLKFNEDFCGLGLAGSIEGLSRDDLVRALNLALEALWCARHTLSDAGYPVLIDDDGRWIGSGWGLLIELPGVPGGG